MIRDDVRSKGDVLRLVRRRHRLGGTRHQGELIKVIEIFETIDDVVKNDTLENDILKIIIDTNRFK